MENNPDLGKLFKKQLANIKTSPDVSIWENIEKTLEKKQKRRVGFIWFFGGLGVLTGILLLSYFVQSGEVNLEKKDTPTHNESYNEQKQSIENRVLQKQTPSNSNSNGNLERSNYKDTLTNKDFQTDTKNTIKSTSNKAGQGTGASRNSVSKTTILVSSESRKATETASDAQNTFKSSVNENLISKTSQQTNKNSKPQIFGENLIDSLSAGENIVDDSIPQNNKPPLRPRKEKEKEPKQEKINPSKWLISLNIGPNYYDYFSKKTPFDESLTAGSGSGQLSYSYGVLLNIPISEKGTFRVGYRISNFTSSVKDAISPISENGNIALLTDAAIERNNLAVPSAILEDLNAGIPFEIVQNLRYSEIPIEFDYTLFNEKVRVDAMGGLNPMLLGKNAIVLKNKSGMIEVGSSRYLKKFTIAPYVGLGLRYHLSEKLRVDLEPTLRYQIDTFEKEYRNLHPFILSINTGLTLKL